MTLLLSIIAFLVIFSVLILVHEWGHFQTARRNGIHVEEFGIGLPPRMWGKKVRGTIYSFNWIPFGGFVRLLGEDAADEKQRRNAKAFVSQSLWVRTKVVCAGVFMNFVLAVALLTVGFVFGIRPLIVGVDDLFATIASGHVTVAPGAVLKEVLPGSVAARAGLAVGDRVTFVQGTSVADPVFVEESLRSKDDVSLTVQRGEQSLSFFLELAEGEKSFGIVPHTLVALPRIQLATVSLDSPLFQGGLRPGDVLLSFAGQEVYGLADIQRLLQSSEDRSYTAYRHGTLVSGVLPDSALGVVVSEVLPESRAKLAGLLAGDRIVRVNGALVRSPQDFVGLPMTAREYVAARDGQELRFTIVPDERGLIGIVVAPFFDASLLSGLQFFPVNHLSSITEILPVSYPVWKAPFAALSESVRLSGLTVEMFGGIVTRLVSRFEVPDGIAGPVGIAQLTHSFVQEGFLSLVRFMALLSLSLAVINILPIPALDGGRLLFLIIEFVRGKPGNMRVERMAHTIGFALLIALLVAVTYKDLVRIFAG